MKKIAIISDIHGNLVALEAVLADLERQGGADRIVIPGDLFAFGPAPYETLAALHQLKNSYFLLGNTDRYLLERTYPTTLTDNTWQNQLLYSFHWTAERLGVDGLNFLNTLPKFQLLQIGSRQLLAVHGSPRNDEEGLTQKTTFADLEAMLLSPQISILIGGHTHIPMDRLMGDLRILNAGSVGLPFDGDPRACYVLISNLTAKNGYSLDIEFRRVAYDIEKAVKQFYDMDYPAADISAYNLRTAQSIGSSPIYTPEMRHQKVDRPILIQSLVPPERV